MSSIRRPPTRVKRAPTAGIGSGGDRLRDGRRQNWFWVWNETLDEYLPRVGPHAWAVYCYLARRADRHDQCFPSYRTIAGDTGVSRTKVIESIKLLEEVGLLLVERRLDPDSGDATSHLYTVLGGTRGDTPLSPDEPRGGTPGDTRVVRGANPNNTQVNQTHSEVAVSPRVLQLWAATLDAARLPAGLAGDVHQLRPMSWSAGRLVLSAPTATVAGRWERRAEELVRLLAAAAPVALDELAVVTG